jgi:hypothetical protein
LPLYSVACFLCWEEALQFDAIPFIHSFFSFLCFWSLVSLHCNALKYFPYSFF